VRRDLSVVFQDPMAALDPRLPVFDVIAEPMRRLNTAPFVSGNDFTSPSTRSTSGRSSRGTASRAFVCTGGIG